MISFLFDLGFRIEGAGLSPFEMGDIEIKSQDILISSKNKNPNQSMMIFVSLSNLLDLTRRFLINKSNRQLNFTAIDSSFSLLMTLKEGSILLNDCHNIIRVKLIDFAKALYTGTEEFYSAHSFELEQRHGYNDLKHSLAEFSALLVKKGWS